MIWFHITAGFLALSAGAVALSSRKGADLHRRSGMLFVVAMLLMLASGGTMAAIQMIEEPIHRMNVVAATVTAYFVVSSLLTVARPVERFRWMHASAMSMALAASALSVWFGVDALNSKGYGPPPVYFGFAGFALFAAALDARMLHAGSIRGVHRIARHLWRMTFAMLVATLSFFLGQADEIPAPFRNFAILSVPVVMVLLSLIYWLARVLWSRRARSVLVLKEGAHTS